MVKRLELTLFGNLEIRHGGIQVPQLKSMKAQALLCYLAITSRPQTRSVLAGLFWGEMPETNARMNLSQGLSTLRRTLGGHLVITRQTVAFNRDSDFWIDVGSFETRIAAGNMESLHQAVQLYRGDFMNSFYVRQAHEFETWVLVERARLREMALKALRTLAEYHSALGEAGWEAGIGYLRHLLRIEPWHEEAHRELMRLLALSGQRSAALMQFELCRQILVEELGVEPGETTNELYSRIRSDDFKSPDRRHTKTELKIEEPEGQQPSEAIKPGKLPGLTGLPPQPTRFIGRERELEALVDLIFRERKRLVTVVGPGGIGKTRLVLAFAEYLAQTEIPGDPSGAIFRENLPDGVFFVSLESLDSKKSIWSAVANALRFRLDRGESQLLGYLSSKQLLLILDNYEHLTDDVDFFTDFQKSAPHVIVLVTSREPLRLHGEQLFPLKGLDFPSIGSSQSALDCPSGQLFLQAARHHQPDFGLNTSEMRYLAHICQLVEGMPLALELAATWTSSLSVSSIAAEILNSYDFLESEFRNLPSRHRSVRAAIDVSWKRLTPTQKKIFPALSVFRGGFTREASVKITGASFGELASLVESSLLWYVKTLDRYLVHELLRQYGSEKLARDPNELESIQDLHSRYYCGWSWDQLRPPNLRSVGQTIALDVMTQELENVRAAWIWALEKRRINRIWNKASAIGRYYIWRGGYQEGRRIFQAFADLVGDGSESSDARMTFLQATILNWQAFFSYELDDRAKALELLQQSQTLLNSPRLANIDTRGEKAHNLVILARTDWSQSEEERINLLAEARAFYREIKDPFGLPFALTFSGRLAILSGRLTEAQQVIEESLKIYEESGNQLGRAIALTGLGNLAFSENDYDKSVTLLQQSLDLARQIGSRERIIISLMYQGIAYLHSGQFSHAIRVFEQGLAHSTDHSFHNYQATSLYNLGYSFLHLGAYDKAVKCGNEALKLTEEKANDTIKYEALMLHAAVAVARGAFEDAATAFEQVFKDRDSWRSGKFMLGEDPCGVGLGAALLQLEEIERARLILDSLLERALNTHRLDRVLYTIVGFALLNARAGSREQANKLYSLTKRYPLIHNSRWIADTFGQYIVGTAGELSAYRMKEFNAENLDNDLWEVAEALRNVGEIQ